MSAFGEQVRLLKEFEESVEDLTIGRDRAGEWYGDTPSGRWHAHDPGLLLDKLKADYCPEEPISPSP